MPKSGICGGSFSFYRLRNRVVAFDWPARITQKLNVVFNRRDVKPLKCPFYRYFLSCRAIYTMPKVKAAW